MEQVNLLNGSQVIISPFGSHRRLTSACVCVCGSFRNCGRDFVRSAVLKCRVRAESCKVCVCVCVHMCEGVWTGHGDIGRGRVMDDEKDSGPQRANPKSNTGNCVKME